jgi:hypothetical protein
MNVAIASISTLVIFCIGTLIAFAQQSPGVTRHTTKLFNVGIQSELVLVSPDTGSDAATIEIRTFDPGTPWSGTTPTPVSAELWKNNAHFVTLTPLPNGRFKAPLPAGWTASMTKYEVRAMDAAGTTVFSHTIDDLFVIP